MRTASLRPVPPDIPTLREQLAPIFKRHAVLKAIVFGSVARGEASPGSDVDLIVVCDADKRFLDRYGDLLYELNLAVQGSAVEVLIYTPEELERLKGRRFIARALQEGQVIYECER